MQNAKKTRRWADGQSESGGPGGAMPPAPSSEAEPAPEPLSLDAARAIKDLYVRGAAKNFVTAITYPLVALQRMRAQGLIETRLAVRGRIEAQLTPRGLQRLFEANQIVDAGAAAL